MTLLEYESFSFVFEECVINYFSISILSFTHLFYGLGELFTIRIGIYPIRITDYRYKLIFLHGSTCWLGDSFSHAIQLEKLSSLTRLTELKLEAIGWAWLHGFSYWLPGFLLDGQGRRGFKVSKYLRTNSLSMEFPYGECSLFSIYADDAMLLAQSCLLLLIGKILSNGDWMILCADLTLVGYFDEFTSWLVDYAL